MFICCSSANMLMFIILIQTRFPGVFHDFQIRMYLLILRILPLLYPSVMFDASSLIPKQCNSFSENIRYLHAVNIFSICMIILDPFESLQNYIDRMNKNRFRFNLLILKKNVYLSTNT